MLVKHRSVKKIIYIYVKYFILLDIIVGFSINYLGTEGSLHPGLLIRGALLALLVIDLLSSLNSNKSKSKNLIILFLIFTTLSICINTLLRLNYNFFVHEIINVSKPIFIILLSHYIYRHKLYFKSKINDILKTNYWVFTINIVFSFFTGLGISTYDNVAGSTKGFLDAGNSASILALIFLIYFLFENRITKIEKIFYLLLSITVIYMVGTKVIFLVPIVLLIYMLMALFRSRQQRLLKSAVVLIPSVLILIIVVPDLLNILLPRYLPMLKNLNLANIGQITFYDFLMTYRRTYYAIEQTIFQFSDFVVLLFGVGDTGQTEFWKGYGFKFAGMDYFDFLFQYGLICFGFLIYYTTKAIRLSFLNKNEISIQLCLIFIVLYSFFGGYVLYSLTSGTMLAFLFGLNLNIK